MTLIPPLSADPATLGLEPLTDVSAGRHRIDDLDAGIRDLIAQRIALSRQIQAIRRAEGRPGVQHSRENEIVTGYVDALGDPGADIALAVLTLCRGRV